MYFNIFIMYANKFSLTKCDALMKYSRIHFDYSYINEYDEDINQYYPRILIRNRTYNSERLTLIYSEAILVPSANY